MLAEIANAGVYDRAAALLCAALIAVAHIMRRDLHFCASSLSVYFAGRTRPLMFVAYALLAGSLVMRAAMLGTMLLWSAHASALFCLISASGLLLVALTARRTAGDVDPRSPRTVIAHRYSALATFASATTAMVADAAENVTTGTAGAWVSAISAVVAVVAFFVLVTSGPGPTYGLRQKLLLGAVLAWLAY